MSTIAAERTAVPASRHRGGIRAVYGVELTKIRSQLLARFAALVCLVGPFVFVIIMKTQTSAPADTLFGRWVHTSGFAIPFIVLGFAGVAGFPLLTAVVAGDIFASEDRLSTWKTLLTRSVTRRDIFVGKTLAACTYSVVVVVTLALSSLAAGALLIGTQPLVSLSGELLSPTKALVLILESWGFVLVPVLAFTCLAVLFSIASRNSIAGVLGPVVVGLLMVLLSLLGSGVIVRTLMLTTPFEAWHGMMVEPVHLLPLALGAAVCFGYGYLSLDSAWSMLRKRDFAGEQMDRTIWQRLLRPAIIGLAAVAVLALASALDRTAITADRLEASVASTFRNLVVVQRGMLGKAVAPGSLQVFPFCKRNSVIRGPSSGAGDDWVCSLNVNGPAGSSLGQLTVSYDMTVRPNGCYTGSGSTAVVGPLRIRTSSGESSVNPLYAFDGCLVSP